MRILFVSPYIPSPTRYRSYNIIQSLVDLGHQITVVCLGIDDTHTDDIAKAKLEEICEAVHVTPFSRGDSLVNSALHLATSTPLWVASYFTRGIGSVLRRTLEEGNFDIAHVEHLRTARVSRILKNRLPVIFDSVDCMSDVQKERLLADYSNPLERAVSRSEYEKIQRYEPLSAANFDRVIVSSEQAAERLVELGEAQGVSLQVDVIANGVDMEYFKPQPEVEIIRGNLVFFGHFSNPANQNAAKFFINEVFPGIRNAFPWATVTFVGSNPSPELIAFAEAHNSAIEVTGYVEDPRPYIARAAVAICPIRAISTIHNRVLHLMSMGKAVVAEPAAGRGLGASAAGESVCFADTALSFATQIVHLLNHPEEAERLGKSAREYVEKNHNWNQIAKQLTQIYHEVKAEKESHATA